MTKQKIAIDIDDVLADSNEAMRLWANKVSGVELAQEHYQVPGEYWSYYERIWATHGVEDRLNFDDFEAELLKDQTNVPLLAGASFAIKELQKKYTVILLTSRNPALEEGTKNWVDTHMGGGIELYFAKNMRMNAGKSKGELCKEMGVSLLIDDNIDHCQSALDNGIDAVLFGDYGWHHSVPEGAVNCKDWPATLEYLDGRSK